MITTCMRTLLITILSALLCMSCSAARTNEQAPRVLFVGNSLTYVGNLPAVFSALAATNGHVVHSDMIVRGGATLTQRVADGSVAHALAKHRYSILVLQERGGDLTCSFGPDSCAQSRRAIKTLAALGHQHGVTVVLLGTYQPHPIASRQLVAEESAAANAASVPYVEVSEQFQRLQRLHPELIWFDADGGHPGTHLTLLDAILLHRQLFGAWPADRGFAVNAPIYAPASGLGEALRSADDPPPRSDTPNVLSHESEVIGKILKAIHHEEPSP